MDHTPWWETSSQNTVNEANPGRAGRERRGLHPLFFPRTHDPKIVRKMPLSKRSYDNRIISTALPRADQDSSSDCIYRTCTKNVFVRCQIVRFSFNQYSCRSKMQYKCITTHDITSDFLFCRTRIFVGFYPLFSTKLLLQWRLAIWLCCLQV